MKRPAAILSTLIIVLLSLFTLGVSAGNAGSAGSAGSTGSVGISGVSAKGAILIDQDSGKVLYEKDSHKRLYPASTTKIMTALLAVEYGNLTDKVIIGNEIYLTRMDSSKAGLVQGQMMSLGNLLRGMMLPSGNDAANTIAVYVARKVSGNESMDVRQALDYFAGMMNRNAGELGASDTHFVNPHGYHNPNHYTTAYDMALIAREAMKYKFFRQVVGTEAFRWSTSKTRPGTVPGEVIGVWSNRNDLIDSHSKHFFRYATGIKTGHTSQAGYCLVSSAAKDGHRLIAVVMDSTEEGEWADSIKLLKYGLAKENQPVPKNQSGTGINPPAAQTKVKPGPMPNPVSSYFPDKFITGEWLSRLLPATGIAVAVVGLGVIAMAGVRRKTRKWKRKRR